MPHEVRRGRKNWRSSQMQNVNTLINRPVRTGTAAAGGLVAFVAGALLAVSAPAVLSTLSTSHSSNVTFSAPAVGAEQIAHNRSEMNLGVAPSAGAEQIAHNRSEQNFGASPRRCGRAPDPPSVGWEWKARLGLLSVHPMVDMTTDTAQLRGRVSRSQAFWIVAAIFGLFLFAAAAPSPLYAVYASSWLFSAIELTEVFAVSVVAVVLIPEPATKRRELRLLPRVGVEPATRPAFFAALPSLIAGWGVAGFYLSLGPSLALQLAASHNRTLGGLAIALLAGIGAVCVIAVRTWQAARAMRFGAVALAAGLALTVAAVALKAPLLFFGGTAATGIGFGVAWLGVVRSLVGLASPTGRGALLAAIFIVAYLAFALPAVVAGYAVTRVGLHDAALWYGVAVEVLALAGVAGTLLINRPSQVAALDSVSR